MQPVYMRKPLWLFRCAGAPCIHAGISYFLGPVFTSSHFTESTIDSTLLFLFLALRMGLRRSIEKKAGNSTRSKGLRFAFVLSQQACVATNRCLSGAARVAEVETDAAKIRFCKNALAAEYDFERPAVISEQAVSAIDWSMKRTASEAACAREKIICQIEQIAHELWSSGESQQWLEGCADAAVKHIAAHVNGPLLLRLAKLIGYHDISCVDLLRHGEHGNHRSLCIPFLFLYYFLRRPVARNSTLQ